MTDADYQPPQVATPGWELAPVPGWGVNPLRAGPSVLATSGVPIRSIVADWTPVQPMGVTDSEKQGQQGAVALGVAGGIFFGWTLAWIYWSSKKSRKRV
jgi:hypothetical protein